MESFKGESKEMNDKHEKVLGKFVENNWGSESMGSLREFYDSELAQFHQSLYFEAKKGESVEGIQTRDRVKEMIHLAGDVSGKSILEIGMGVGLFSSEFARIGARVTGLDFSLFMLKTARDLAQQEDIKYMGLTQAAAPNIPFRDSSFDCIILGDVVEHLVPKVVVNTFLECHRLVRPNGLLIIHTAPSRYSQLLTVDRHFLALGMPLLLLRLPQKIIEKWLEIIFSFRLIYKRRISKTLGKNEMPHDEHGHINCQTIQSLSEQLEEAGFKIRECYSKELFIRNKDLFKRIPFRFIPGPNRHFLMRSIFGVGVKCS